MGQSFDSYGRGLYYKLKIINFSTLDRQTKLLEESLFLDRQFGSCFGPFAIAG